MRTTKNSVFYNEFQSETSLIDVATYFSDYRNQLHCIDVARGKNIFNCKKQENEFYAQKLGIPLEQIEELAMVTSSDNLTCAEEVKPLNHELHENNSDFIMKYEMGSKSQDIDHPLESVKKRMEASADLYARYNLKYEQYVWLKNEKLSSCKKDMNPFDFSTVLYSIKVYHPYLSYSGEMYRVKILQEIHMLGNQYLSQLENEICCSMDYTGIHDVSFCPDLNINDSDLKRREENSPSFIFIENVFYNNTGGDPARDISKSIIDWANGRGLGPFSVKSMKDTKMIDLKLRIGHPYVYQHQGDCEHVIVISDVHFLQTDDVRRGCGFPRVHAKGRHAAKLCMMCGAAYARWFVTGNERLTHDKNYFCHNCFISYNYKNGKKIGNFKAFQYVDPVAIL